MVSEATEEFVPVKRNVVPLARAEAFCGLSDYVRKRADHEPGYAPKTMERRLFCGDKRSAPDDDDGVVWVPPNKRPRLAE
jgi:hypothetical protein